MTASTTSLHETQTAEFENLWGHPKPLWMLFMAEFWERFAFYGMRWALTLYIVAQFFDGDPSGQKWAGQTYGAYLALIYASAIFGGYIADKILGSQRSILTGALIMGVGLFMVMIPNQEIFLLGLSTIIIGNGLFKPNISSQVGQLYPQGDPRRDRGFTLFYMGINAGAMISPIITHWAASHFNNTPMTENYKLVFLISGIGMLISIVWFSLGRRQLKHVGMPPSQNHINKKNLLVFLGAIAAIIPTYFLMSRVGAVWIGWMLLALFFAVSVILIRSGLHDGKIGVERVYAMLILFAFNVLFFMFFEQAGSSFNFLADNMVDRKITETLEFPVAWFQSVNPTLILVLAPVMAGVWALTARRNLEPSIPRKFALGLLFNALGFAVLWYALVALIDGNNMIPLWTLIACYFLQTIGELCLSPIGLSMVTKLAPMRSVGFAMGGWFLCTAIGNNLSGILAGDISGETGMTAQSAIDGFSFSFKLLVGAAIVLFFLAPLVNKLTHGIK